MLDSDEYHFTVGLLQDGMNLLGPLSPVPWLVRIGYSVPYVAQNFKDLLGWSAQKLRHRMRVLYHSPTQHYRSDNTFRVSLSNAMSVKIVV